jgi:hypothetical protein
VAVSLACYGSTEIGRTGTASFALTSRPQGPIHPYFLSRGGMANGNQRTVRVAVFVEKSTEKGLTVTSG